MKKYKSKKAGIEIIRTYRQLLLKWNIDVNERMLDTRYGKTCVLECGKEDGAPVVLFHGVGDNSALMWMFNAAALGVHFRLYAVDTIGGPGLSEFDDRYDKSFDDVLWIDDVLEALSLEQTSMIGVSHGGYMVQLYTLKRPDKVKRAVGISAAVPIGQAGNPMKTMMKIFLPEALFPTKKNVHKLLKKLSGKNYGVFTEDPFIMEHYGWLLRGFNNMAMGYHKVTGFTEEEVEQLKDRVVYLAGEADPFMKLGGKTALVEMGMNVEFYEEAGHGLNQELADQINERLIQLLLL